MSNADRKFRRRWQREGRLDRIEFHVPGSEAHDGTILVPETGQVIRAPWWRRAWRAFWRWFALPLVAGTLTFNLPTFNADTLGRCGSGVSLCMDLASWSLYGQRQSLTWVAKRDSMLADERVWTRYWPTVRSEALPARLEVNPASSPGASVSFTPLAGWQFYYVTTSDSAGNEACRSNVVGAP